MRGFIIVQNPKILVPVERIIKEYEHLTPFLTEHQLSLMDLVTLSFDVSNLNLSFNNRPGFAWSAMSVMSDYFIAHRQNPQMEMTDDEAIVIHQLTCLAQEIHGRIQEMVNQYVPQPNLGYHGIAQWVGRNILINTFN
ncbi:hypothetical protein D3C80_907910 [compost metagenome]